MGRGPSVSAQQGRRRLARFIRPEWRVKQLQTTLIEAAKVAPRWRAEFALLYEREKQRGNRNRATLALARKLVAYLMAVNRGERGFEPQAPAAAAKPSRTGETPCTKMRTATTSASDLSM